MIIEVKVKPNSKEQEIIKTGENEYKISLKEKAEDNKANIELLKLLGLKSRNKIVEVKD